jgi:nitric oxide reductase NorD protein
MRSPRALALRVAYRLTRLAGRVRDVRARREPPTLALDRVRRRLELLIAAVHDSSVTIEPAAASPRSGWLGRLTRTTPLLADARAHAAGDRVQLPASLASADGDADALARYRLLALEQAERLVRGTARALPDDGDPLARDLYLLREGLAADAAIVRRAPGFRDALRRARAEALALRPPPERLGEPERIVEQMVRESLTADPDGDALETTGAADSRAWAEATAARLRASGAARYRGVPPVAYWGAAPRRDASPARAPNPVPQPPNLVKIEGAASAAGQRKGEQEGSSGEGRGDPDDDGPPPSEGAATGPRQDAEGTNRLAPAQPDEPGAGAAGVAATDPFAPTPPPDLEATRYPEWDEGAGHYAREAIVRHAPPDEGDPAWADAALHAHAVLVRQVRARFERLRPRRVRLRRTRDGDALDVEACVQALVERRAGFAPDDRLYVATRAARRPIAIAVLVDASGSTETQVTADHRVIDVERVAVLLAATALDALGDHYAVLAFSGQGASDVRVRTLKGFAERNGETVRRRVSALAPGGFTRLGAALRHATALLVRQPGSHRLLLVLSDGKPNDVDGYHAEYAVEDARMAVHEAHARGVVPFCLTVDAEEPEYLAHVFGPAGYTILRDPEQLPLALLGVVRRLLSS